MEDNSLLRGNVYIYTNIMPDIWAGYWVLIWHVTTVYMYSTLLFMKALRQRTPWCWTLRKRASLPRKEVELQPLRMLSNTSSPLCSPNFFTQLQGNTHHYIPHPATAHPVTGKHTCREVSPLRDLPLLLGQSFWWIQDCLEHVISFDCMTNCYDT